MSVIRFSGMASGMDTETMVKKLMDAEKLRLNKYNQQKQIKKWTQEAYNDTNKDIANFILDTKKELGVGFGGSISGASWIKKSTLSNTSAIDASATSSAVSGTHNLEVVKLAEGVNKASQGDIEDDAFGTAGSITFETSDGKSISVAYEATDTPSSLAEKINKESDLGLTANYDSSSDRFFLSTKGTGESQQIKITSDDKKILAGAGSALKTDLRLYAPADTVDINDKGKDAEINFDGANGITYPSNNFIINGISVIAKEKGTSTINIDTDVDGVYDKIKGFVDKYNELLDKLDKKTSEKRYRDYQPLTDEQKKAMDDDTVKKWEEKAKSGLLRGDEHITKLLDTTRAGLYESVYSDYKDDADKNNDTKLSGFSFLTEIGITTGTYQEKGKLQIDEHKLKEAITNDVDGVMDLLFKTPGETTTDKEKRAETGIINRLYDDMIDGMKNIIDKSGTGDNASLYREVKSTILIDFVTKSGSISLLDKDVLNIEKQIGRENDRLTNIENRYWRQFTAMEKAMNQMNTQSSWLASQMGGM